MITTPAATDIAAMAIAWKRKKERQVDKAHMSAEANSQYLYYEE